SSPRHAARERAAVHPQLGCREDGLHGSAASGRATARALSSRLLPDVEPRSSGGDPPETSRFGGRLQANLRPLCLLLERLTSIQRSRLARPVLLLPFRYDAPMGSAALCGA